MNMEDFQKQVSLYRFFQNQRIEHPHYTKPREFEGLTVPDVLLSGHHANIEKFQQAESLRLTQEYRPDLLHE